MAEDSWSTGLLDMQSIEEYMTITELNANQSEFRGFLGMKNMKIYMKTEFKTILFLIL